MEFPMTLHLYEDNDTTPVWIGDAEEILEANEGNGEVEEAVFEILEGRAEKISLGGGAATLITICKEGVTP